MHYSTVKASIYFFHCQKEQELQNKKTQTSYTKNIIHPLEKTTIFDYNFFQCSHLTDLQNSLKEFSNKTHINSDVVIQLKERRLLYFLHSKERLCQSFDTFTFAVLNITTKYKCIFEKQSCSELTLTLVLNDYRLNQTATLLIGEPSQLELQAHDLINVLAVSPSCLIL